MQISISQSSTSTLPRSNSYLRVQYLQYFNQRVSNNICCCAPCCGAVPLRRRPCCNRSICPTCRDTAANLLHAAGQIDGRTDRQIDGRTPYCYIDPASDTMRAVRKMHKLELPYRVCTVKLSQIKSQSTV